MGNIKYEKLSKHVCQPQMCPGKGRHTCTEVDDLKTSLSSVPPSGALISEARGFKTQLSLLRSPAAVCLL